MGVSDVGNLDEVENTLFVNVAYSERWLKIKERGINCETKATRTSEIMQSIDL